MNSDNSRHRLGLLAIFALSLFGALFARLWFLQVVEGPDLEAQVNQNARREVVIPAPRGRILDRNGIALVTNREVIVVAVDTQAHAELDEPEQERLLEQLATSLSRWVPPDEAVTVDFLEKRLADQRFSRFRPVPVAEINVEQEIYFREQAERYPSVVVERQTVRSYPYGSLAAHVLGYVGAITEEEYEQRHVDPDEVEEDEIDDADPSELPIGVTKPYDRSDEIGKAGVERTYEEYLRGTPGRQVFEVDRRNRVVREITELREEPVPGDDVHLSIDARIQYRTEEALQAQIAKADPPNPSGAAVVLDPRNGQVWAMASYPTYDPHQLVGGISQDLYDELTARPTLAMSNRAIQEAYPPASTFKLGSSFAGLNLGLITPEMVINDPGSYRLCPGSQAGCLKHNSGGAPHGSISLASALEVSSNVYYYRIGDLAWKAHQRGELPEDALQEQLQVLGYGEKTGIDLTAETAGRIPTPESNRALADALWEADPANYNNSEAEHERARRWEGGFNADVAIGEFDTLVTPLQNANAYASVLNPEGSLFRPSILSHITDTESEEITGTFEPEVIRNIDYGPGRGVILDGLHRVVSGGTARGVFAAFPLAEFPVAGKTGTSSVGTSADRPDNSLFVGFGPTDATVEEDQYVISVIIEGGGYGSLAAAPAAAMVFNSLASGEYQTLEIPPGAPIDVQAALQRAANIGTGTAD